MAVPALKMEENKHEQVLERIAKQLTIINARLDAIERQLERVEGKLDFVLFDDEQFGDIH